MISPLAASLGLAAAAVVVTPAAAQQREAIPLAEQPGHVTIAVVVIDAPPARVYEVMTDYENWRQILTDVTRVEVERGGRDDARVRFRSRALDHTVTVQFDNVPGRAIRFVGVEGPPGGKARGEYRLTPVDDGTRTRVDAELYLDVEGVAGWLVRDKATRAMRRAKLRADLADVVAWFGARAGASGGPRPASTD